MCTGRSSPLFMSAYTVVRPTRRTIAASSGVRRSRSGAVTSRSGCGLLMSASPGSIARFCVTAAPQRWGGGLQNISSPSPTTRARAFERADWRRVERLLLATAEALKLGSEQVGSAAELGASPGDLQYGL